MKDRIESLKEPTADVICALDRVLNGEEDVCDSTSILNEIVSEDASLFSALVRVLNTKVIEVDDRIDIFIECLGLDTFSQGFNVFLYFGYEGCSSLEAKKKATEFCDGCICKVSGTFCIEPKIVYFFFPVKTVYQGDIDAANNAFDSYLEIIGDFPTRNVDHPIHLLKVKLDGL